MGGRSDLFRREELVLPSCMATVRTLARKVRTGEAGARLDLEVPFAILIGAFPAEIPLFVPLKRNRNLIAQGFEIASTEGHGVHWSVKRPIRVLP